MEVKTLEESEIKIEKICSDYDNECCDVPDPTKCFLGDMPCPESNTNFGIADGVCPEMRRKNEN